MGAVCPSRKHAARCSPSIPHQTLAVTAPASASISVQEAEARCRDGFARSSRRARVPRSCGHPRGQGAGRSQSRWCRAARDQRLRRRCRATRPRSRHRALRSKGRTRSARYAARPAPLRVRRAASRCSRDRAPRAWRRCPHSARCGRPEPRQARRPRGPPHRIPTRGHTGVTSWRSVHRRTSCAACAHRPIPGTGRLLEGLGSPFGPDRRARRTGCR